MSNMKFNEWFQGAMRGEESYLLVNKVDGKWVVHDSGEQDEIFAISVVVFKENEPQVFYEWDKYTRCNNKRNFALIMKDEKKLMLQDEKEGLYAFGLPSQEDDIEKILIFFSTQDVNAVICTTKQQKHINMCFETLISSENSLQSCLGEIIHGLNKKDCIRNEVKENVAATSWFES